MANTPNKEGAPSFITDDMVSWETARAGGPGGQNVNRRATAARLRLPLGSLSLEKEEVQALQKHLPPRYLTQNNELIVENSETRTQARNKKRALELANAAIADALSAAEHERKRALHKKHVKKRLSAQAGSGGGGGAQNLHEKKAQQHRRETTDDLLGEALKDDPDLADELGLGS